MMSLGALAFASPWLLLALLSLPVLWWLLRVTPPAPKLVRFPPIRLLFHLTQKEETPAHTPLWLLLLRLTMAALIIVGLAHPLLNPGRTLEGEGPVILVVDNGWAAARRWNERRQAMLDVVDQAERAGRSLIVLATAPATADQPLEASKLLAAGEARNLVRGLAPLPWPLDRQAAMAALDAIDAPTATAVWLSDGLASPGGEAFARRLAKFGDLRVITGEPHDLPVLLLPPSVSQDQMTARARRADGSGVVVYQVYAVGDNGGVLARGELRFEAGEREAAVRLRMPAELLNRAARLEIENQRTAGAVVLLDERWRRRPVGLVSATGIGSGHPLLSDLYYLQRALSPFSEVRRGRVGELLDRPLSVIVLHDDAPLDSNERTEIDAWMKKGGVVLRFAGPRIARGDDTLVPVKLRKGDRAFGGRMSWTKPMHLAPFERHSPFAGLPTPADVTVRRQVLAEPAADLAKKTWARLTDGTPLVTAARRGEGWLILVHTTANTDWSNLPLAGLFVDMLRRVVALSHGVASTDEETSLPPREILDGFGSLRRAPGNLTAIAHKDFDKTRAGPRHPPGYYGTDEARRSLNLSPSIATLEPIGSLPAGAIRDGFDAARETDFKPWLLAASLVLAILDTLVSLLLRGFVPSVRGRRSTAAVLLAATLMVAGRAEAEVAPIDLDYALAASLETRLAYVKTGDADVDRVTEAALKALGRVLTLRTSVEPAGPLAIDIEKDDLALLPFLYWPVTAGQTPPSPRAVRRINAYIRAGGMLVFDIRDGADGAFGPRASSLRRIAGALAIPPLVPLPRDHVLTKSFYLLQRFPGRWARGTVWVERPERTVNDGVSSVIVGTNDWAGAWAMDGNQNYLYAVVPGGESQREQAFRAGINLVMYALTGNYKSDQVHIPTILRRLGQ